MKQDELLDLELRGGRSLRGARIETQTGRKRSHQYAVAPSGERGLKHDPTTQRWEPAAVAPSGERGLKQFVNPNPDAFGMSLPQGSAD